MSINPTLLFIIILVYHTSSFSLTDEKEYDKEAYASSLLETQSEFESKLEDLKQEISEVRQVLSNTSMTNKVKVVALQEGMAEERDIVYQMQKGLKLPFNLRSCQCANVSKESRESLSNKLDEIALKISKLRSSLKNCSFSRCPKYEELALEISQAENYLHIMNETVNAECCKAGFEFQAENATGLVNLNGSIYKDNLKSNNWFYGDTTEKEYILSRFELATKYNLTSCPENFPFADLLTNKCGKCPKTNEYFNLGNRKCYSCSDSPTVFLNRTSGHCDSCPKLQYFDNNTQKCKTCPDGMVYSPGEGKCSGCKGNQYPDFTTFTCGNCTDEYYYNAKSAVCQSCNLTNGEFLNKTTFKCQPCALGLYYSVSEKKCVHCPSNSHYNPPSGKCVKCPDPLFWIRSSNSCEVCPSNSYYNIKSYKCSVCPLGTSYSSVLQICIDENTTAHEKCPEDHPYYNQYTKKCEKCDSHEIYDEETNSCIHDNYVSICPPERPKYDASRFTCLECSAGTVWDNKKHDCVGGNGNGTNGNNGNGQCQSDEVYLADAGKCAKTWTTCQTTQYYNSVTLLCETPEYITSPSSSNLLLQTTSYAAYKDKYNIAMSDSGRVKGSLRDCPFDHPYYDPVAKGCLSCIGTNLLWNLETFKCARCGNDYRYDSDQRKCVNLNK